VNCLKWHAHKVREGEWYARSWNCGRRIYMHKFISGLSPVDHVNGDRLDNRRENIRSCTHGQNVQNQRGHSNRRSRFKGVCWYGGKKKWGAEIQADRRVYKLGYFADEAEAARAYNSAASRLHGLFARLNKVA
jgi:hypothetical protein